MFVYAITVAPIFSLSPLPHSHSQSSHHCPCMGHAYMFFSNPLTFFQTVPIVSFLNYFSSLQIALYFHACSYFPPVFSQHSNQSDYLNLSLIMTSQCWTPSNYLHYRANLKVLTWSYKAPSPLWPPWSLS